MIERKTHREAGVGTIYSIVAIAMHRGGELIARIMMARIFSVNEFGAINLGLAFLFFCVSFALVGMELSTVRFIAYYSEKNDKKSVSIVVITAAVIVLLFGFILTLLLLLTTHSITFILNQQNSFARIIRIISIMVIPIALSMLMKSVLSGLKQQQYVALINIVEKATLILFLVIITYVDSAKEASVAFWGYTLSIIPTIIIGSVSIKKSMIFKKISIQEMIERSSELIKYAWRLSLSSFLNPLRLHGELFILGYFLSTASVGGYSAAALLSGTMLLPLLGSETVILAISSGLYANDKLEEIKALYRMLARWLFCFGCLLFGIVLVASGPIMEFIYGKSYLYCSNILIILALSSLANLTSATQGGLHYAFGNTRIIITLILTNTVCGLGFALVLVPIWGLNGAAWARVISLTVSESIGVIALYHLYRIQPFQWPHLGVLLVAGFSWIVVQVIQLYYSLSAFTGALIYAGIFISLMKALRVMPWADIEPALYWMRRKIAV